MTWQFIIILSYTLLFSSLVLSFKVVALLVWGGRAF